MMFMMIVYIYLFFMGLISFLLIRKHMLLCLISFEFIILCLLMLIYSYCSMFNYSFYIYLLMMTFYVCESVLGLGILVNLIRCHGNDYLNSFFMW